MFMFRKCAINRDDKNVPCLYLHVGSYITLVKEFAWCVNGWAEEALVDSTLQNHCDLLVSDH